jgi:hypothetical protein
MRQAAARETAAGSQAWAEAEFGAARLGDKRRTRRLVTMAQKAAGSPHGKVTHTFPGGAEQQAAYDFLENEHISPQPLLDAASQGAWKRAAGRRVHVALDGSTLSVVEASRERGFGRVGPSKLGACGAESMNAVLLSGKGRPLGLVGHAMWTRAFKKRAGRTDTLPVEEKETRYWLVLAQYVVDGWKASGFEGVPWLHLDAGADAREVLEWMVWSSEGARVTVRAAQDRKCLWPGEECLRTVMAAQPARRPYRLKVPESEGRQARTARMVVRFSPVVVRLRCPRTDRVLPVQLWAVHARETGTCPEGEKPLDWLLLTNEPVESYAEAREVIASYTLRWRVEEVHRAWKKTGCQVEQTALHYQAFTLWALVLLCVAVRAERLKRLAREAPDTPASHEFSPQELKALLLLKKKRQLLESGEVPCIKDAVTWLAELGGYTGPSSGGPPGAATLRRGLDKLAPTADALRFQESMED